MQQRLSRSSSGAKMRGRKKGKGEADDDGGRQG